jgi:drug/metabolite transporter (DMT)-like permease
MEPDENLVSQPQKHWLWGNWVLLALTASVTFTTCNLLIGEISLLGMASCYYFNTGYLVISILYFLRRELCPKKGAIQKDFLTNTEDGSFRWNVVFWLSYSAILQTAIFLCIGLTFSTSKKSGLNPGIATAIWSLTPVFSAFADKVIYKVELQTYHMVGIFFMVSCGVAVGISDIIVPQEKILLPEQIATGQDVFVPTLPVYVAVLCSILMPVAVTF